MTSSRSSISRSSTWLVLAVAIVLFAVGRADAGRKRVVVLEFEGPKAEKFHSDVIKLVRKSHTVVSVDKWNGMAEELDAGKVTEKNVKKIARKLKVDGVITGKVDKRRDEYVIKLRLRAGTTGEILGGTFSTKADGPRLDGQAQRDIKDELIAAIDELDSNRGGGDDDDEGDKPKKKKGDDDDEGDDKPRKSGFSRKGDDDGDDEDSSSKKKKKKKADDEGDDERTALSTKKGDDDEGDDSSSRKKKKKADDADDDDDDRRSKKKKKKKKRKASADDDEDEDEDSDEVDEEVEVDDADHELNVSPGRRAVDAVVGMSFTARKLSFSYAADLASAPPGYRQSIPVAGAIVDLTLFPLAVGHKAKGLPTQFGLNVLYDQVLVINSKKNYIDDTTGNVLPANLDTKESRWSVGVVYRYPLGTGPRAPVVGGSLSYGKQKFEVAQLLPNGDATDIPNVNYVMFSPAAFVRFPVLPKISLNLDAAAHAMTDTGAIQTRTQYGYATVTGFEIKLGGEYMITPSIFARAQFRYQTIGFTFKGDPMSLANTRDSDPEQDVTGAKDVYMGGTATVGYVY